MSEYLVTGLKHGSGILGNLPGAETVPPYSLVYVTAGSQWALADADALATTPVVAMATDGLRAGQKGKLLFMGLVNNNAWSWTSGGILYASTTAGELTQTKPSGSGDVIQEVGMAITATLIYFSGSGLGGTDIMQIFEYQAPAVLNQAAPVQNTWYTLLDTTANVRLYCVSVSIAATGETLEVQATVDGQLIQALGTAVAAGASFFGAPRASPTLQADVFEIAAINDFKNIDFIGKSIKIEVRKTTANGVGNLQGVVMYGVLSNT